MDTTTQGLSQLGAAVTPAPSLVMHCQRVFPVMTLTLGGMPCKVVSFDVSECLSLVEWLCGAAMDWPSLGYVESCGPW